MKRLVSIAVAGTIWASVACSAEEVPRVIKKTFYMPLGASDTVGVGAIPLTDGYVYRIKRELAKHLPGVELLNLGVPEGRIGLIRDQLNVALQLGVHLQLVTLWTGATDLVAGDDPKAFETELRVILQRLRKETTAVVVMANLPDLTQLRHFRAYPAPPEVTADRVKAFNDAIARQAQANKVSLVNLFTEEGRDALMWDPDGFHPNNEGHRVIAELFLKVILPIFKIE